MLDAFSNYYKEKAQNCVCVYLLIIWVAREPRRLSVLPIAIGISTHD